MKLTRQEILNQAAQKLRQDFEEVRASVPHRGLKGDEAHRLVRDFIGERLPKRFATGSGFILDRVGGVSQQTDVLIYDAFYCPVIRTSAEAGVYPNDNVAAIIEVKSRLNKMDLEDAFKKIAVAKSLAKTPPPPQMPHLMVETFGCVFTFGSDLTLDKVLEHTTAFTKQYGVERSPNVVLVLDQGLLTLRMRPRSGVPLPGADQWPVQLKLPRPLEEGLSAVLLEYFGRASLDEFFKTILIYLLLFYGRMALFKDEGPELSPPKLSYVGSHSDETDPTKKQQFLDDYERVAKDFIAKFNSEDNRRAVRRERIDSAPR